MCIFAVFIIAYGIYQILLITGVDNRKKYCTKCMLISSIVVIKMDFECYHKANWSNFRRWMRSWDKAGTQQLLKDMEQLVDQLVHWFYLNLISLFLMHKILPSFSIFFSSSSFPYFLIYFYTLFFFIFSNLQFLKRLKFFGKWHLQKHENEKHVDIKWWISFNQSGGFMWKILNVWVCERKLCANWRLFFCSFQKKLKFNRVIECIAILFGAFQWLVKRGSRKWYHFCQLQRIFGIVPIDFNTFLIFSDHNWKRTVTCARNFRFPTFKKH